MRRHRPGRFAASRFSVLAGRFPRSSTAHAYAPHAQGDTGSDPVRHGDVEAARGSMAGRHTSWKMRRPLRRAGRRNARSTAANRARDTSTRTVPVADTPSSASTSAPARRDGGARQAPAVGPAAQDRPLAPSLAELGYEVTWNDFRSELADYVKAKHERGVVHYSPGNALELKFAEPFDAVLLGEVIEHVAHPDRFLAKISEFVRPNGWIVLTPHPNGGRIVTRCRASRIARTPSSTRRSSSGRTPTVTSFSCTTMRSSGSRRPREVRHLARHVLRPAITSGTCSRADT